MKIVFVTNMCTHYVMKLFENLAKQYDIRFYFTGGHEAYWEKKNKVYLGNFRGEYLNGFWMGKCLKISWPLFSLFWKPWDIMIKTIDDRFALPVCFAAAKIRRKPFILWTGLWHHPQSRAHRISEALTKFIYRHSDAIVVYGTHVKDYLVRLGIDKEKIFIAFHSVDNTRFNGNVSRERKQVLKAEWGIIQKKVILYVGRLEECKGLDYLAEALAQLPQKDFCLLFIGCGSQKEKLKARCSQGGFDCRFLDYIENEKLFEYYAIADIFVLPSVTTMDFKEPWGLVINEAMNQGCAIIATNAVGAAAGGLVDNGKNGLVVQERSVKALQEAFEGILSNTALLNQMRVGSKKKIEAWTPSRTSEGFFGAIRYVRS